MPSSVWRRLFPGRRQFLARPRHFRPAVEFLEGRFAPASITWKGPAGGLWSTAANWDTGAVPGAGDIAIFDGTTANTNSKMDLANVIGGGHIAGLTIKGNYTGTITLQSDLYADVLNMSGGTIDGSQGLIIWQQTTIGPGVPVATNFGTSYFVAGTIKCSLFRCYGENAHRATLQLAINADGTATGNPDLETSYGDNQYSTLVWTQVNGVKAGDVTVAGGKSIKLQGTFEADNPGGTLGNNDATWYIESNPGSKVLQGKGKFNKNEIKKIGGGGQILKVASAVQDGSPDTFYVIGDITDDGGGGYVEVQSGTLEVDGYYTQNSGTTIVDSGQTLDITASNGGTGSFTLTGGTVTASGTDTTIDAVSFAQSGGTTTLSQGGTLSTDTTALSGGSLTLASGFIDATDGLAIEGGTLYGRGGTITGDVTNSGTLDLIIGTTVNPLNVTGNYTQTSGGIMNANLGGAGSNGYLNVSGVAALGGVLNVVLINGYMPSPGNQFLMVQGAIASPFDAIYLPTLTHGHWLVHYYPTQLILAVIY